MVVPLPGPVLLWALGVELLQARREIFEHVLVVRRDSSGGKLELCDLYGQVGEKKRLRLILSATQP